MEARDRNGIGAVWKAIRSIEAALADAADEREHILDRLDQDEKALKDLLEQLSPLVLAAQHAKWREEQRVADARQEGEQRARQWKLITVFVSVFVGLPVVVQSYAAVIHLANHP